MSVRSIFAGLGRRLTQFLLVEEIRVAVAYVRYVYFVKLRHKLRAMPGTEASADISKRAVRHNAAALDRSVVKARVLTSWSGP